MILYCMCKASGNEIVKEEKPTHGDPATRIPLHATLMRAMTCSKTGVEQYLPDSDGGLHRHYPNGDAFECTACKSIVIRE